MYKHYGHQYIECKPTCADPLNHALTFQVKNLGDNTLQIVSSNPAILFKRMELRLGGCPIDDISDLNRLAKLFTMYQGAGKRLQTAALCFGTKETCLRQRTAME